MAAAIGGIDYSYPVIYQPQSGGTQGQVQGGSNQEAGSNTTPAQASQSADTVSLSKSAQEANPQTQQSANSQKSTQDQDKIASLKKRDQEVRVHEQAHIAAGGQYVRGGATYKFTAGPDGHQYATGGEVSVDTSPVPNNPDATIRKMETVKAAALAPATPSSKDLGVAASATNEIAKATQEKMKKLLAKLGVNTGGSTSGTNGSTSGGTGSDSSSLNPPSSKGQGIDITI